METLRQKFEPVVAFAFVEFGLSEEQFNRQTARQWYLLLDAWTAKQRREDQRFARVCMVLAWCHGDSSATEEDFMPIPAEEQTPEEMMAALQGAGKSNNGQ